MCATSRTVPWSDLQKLTLEHDRHPIRQGHCLCLIMGDADEGHAQTTMLRIDPNAGWDVRQEPTPLREKNSGL
jgi:hypothetical protein